MTTRERIESILKPLPRRFIVSYAVAVTEDCFLAVGHSNVSKEAKIAISLTKQWLKDSSSVTEQQLKEAANASYDGAYTANAASYAASAASYAASAASYAANAAAHATNATNATNAAAAVAYAVYSPHRNLNYYLKMLYTMMDKLPKLYKVVYGIEKLK